MSILFSWNSIFMIRRPHDSIRVESDLHASLGELKYHPCIFRRLLHHFLCDADSVDGDVRSMTNLHLAIPYSRGDDDSSAFHDACWTR